MSEPDYLLLCVLAVVALLGAIQVLSDSWLVRRLRFTKRRRITNEIADLDKEVAKILNFKWLDWPICTIPSASDEHVQRAKELLVKAQAALAAKQIDTAKQYADAGFYELAEMQFSSLRIMQVQKRFLGSPIARCSLLNHYLSGRYLP